MGSRVEWTTDMMRALPATRGEAFAAKSRYFFTGTPCSKAHIAPRQTASGKCLYCVRRVAASNIRIKRERKKRGTYVAQPRPKRHGLSSSIAWMLWKTAKVRAAKKGVPFSIQVTDFIIPDKCPILGLTIDKRWGGRNESSAARANAPSLDRIDPRHGYVPGNVAVISYRANMVKGDGLPGEHRKIAEFILRQNTANLMDAV